jgi:hypothetical protein
MALKVSMTGTGTVGDIAPGWAINESTNSLTIGQRTAGTGSVSFTAKSTDDSLLVINNNSIADVGVLGEIHGVVQSVNQTGLTCNVTQSTYLDTFNTEVSVPPISVGGSLAWFDALGKAIKGGSPRRDYRQPLYEGSELWPYWKTGQATYGFPFDNSPMDNTETYSIDNIFRKSTRFPSGYRYGYSYENNDLPGSLGWNDSSTEPLLPYFDITSYVDEFGNSTIGNYVFQLAVNIIEDYTDLRLYVKVGSAESAPSYSNVFAMTVDGTNDIATIFDLETETARTVDLSSLDHSGPILISFNITTRAISGIPPVAYSTLDVFAKDLNDTTVLATGTFPEIITEWGGSNLYVVGDYINATIAYVNFFRTKTPRNTRPATVYFVPQNSPNLLNINTDGFTPTYFGPYPATSGIAWDLIEDLANAENFQVSTIGDTLYIRDTANSIFNTFGSGILDIANRTPIATNPTSTLSGSKINIAYNNAEFINGVVYDARADGNNVISVNAGESTVTSVKWEIDPISLIQPTRYLATGTGSGAVFTGPLPDGTYFVSDSTGLPISANQWEDYGASLTVNIDPNDNSAIQITLKGPRIEIPSTTGPYSLEANDGVGSFATLKISGSGVFSGDNQLQLITGIDSDKYSRKTVNTISNDFIITEEQAYDRGIWASQKASGPVVTVNFSIPTSSINFVGLTCGSIFNYNNSTYRVISSTINNSSVSITAERYVLVSFVDYLWGSRSVEDYDAEWGNYECQDQIIFPYKGAL